MLEILKTLLYVNRNTLSIRKFLNRVRVMNEYASGKLITESFPNMVHIEPTNVCNLRCVMCPHAFQINRKKGFMEFDLFKRIIDELKGTPAEFIYLHQFGESLLHKDFFKMVRYAKAAGIQVGFSTNATLLDQRNSSELLASGLDFLTLSLDGGTSEIYEKYRIGADWKEVESKCLNFLELRSRHDRGNRMHVVAQTISMKGNENSLQKLMDEFGRFPISFTNKPFNEWGGKFDEITNLSTNSDPTKGVDRQRCEKPYKLLTIEWDGTVVPCTRFFDNQYVYGTFPQKSLREIWNGEAARNFRRLHLSNRRDIDFCNTCICDGPSFLERQAMKVLDIMMIEKLIMDIPFVRGRGVANVTETILAGKNGKFQ